MKRKLLFVLMLFSIPLMAQEYLSGSDSLSFKAGSEKYFIFTMSDSADTFVDTIQAYTQDKGGYWTRVGVHDLYEGEIVNQAIAGDGERGKFLINEPFPISIRLVRTNAADRERRTIIWWSSKGSY
jgi:hypothetical protein